MPIYEYRCGSCGLEKEYLQKVSDALMKTCPQCGQDALSKLISAAGFQLKGSGWYATDFKGAGKAKESSKPAEAATADGASKDSSTESKSEGADAKPAASAGHSCGGGCSCA